MPQQVSWKIGGQQGEGIDSAGELLASGLMQSGFHLYGYRVFSSRIRGGHTNYNLRISTEPTASIADRLDLLVALDQETIGLCAGEMKDSGLIVADTQFAATLPAGSKVSLISAPLTEMAVQAGNAKMRNVVAVGLTAALLGQEPSGWQGPLQEAFETKTTEVTMHNKQAFQAGWAYGKTLSAEGAFLLQLAAGDGTKRDYLTGNEVIARGALDAGARFMSAYPITPASEIMEIMVKALPERGGAMIQTEDEIAACMMAIGANYAGTRAFTATSGPGFSLMVESIGLAAMTETPLVIIDVQRGGPSTGLPSKHEQSDILAACYAPHGDAAKIVMALDSVATAAQDTIEAFNLADEYQCPVVLLSDMQLSSANQTLELTQPNAVSISRGKLIAPETLPELPKNQYYKRYQVTADGISPRALPGTPNGIHHVTGLEHDETGRPAEATANRIAQTDKRQRKMAAVVERFPEPVRADLSAVQPQLLVISLGGATGAVSEAVARLRQDGMTVNQAQIRLLQPFPAGLLQPLFDAATQVVVIEHNATAQLASLIQMHCRHPRPIRSVLKYDGNPFRPGEIVAGCREVLK
jgi:2-oxoglutarate ferredoxin oxidoreductase subunit alpha